MFLKSYLSDRFQYTNVPDTTYLSVNYGIVQGSTLGPIMLLVYIIDFMDSLRLLSFTWYADDTCVCISGYDLNNFINILSIYHKHIKNWFTAYRLTLNPNKNELVIFHSW